MSKELQRIKKMYELFIKKVSGNEKEELNYAEKQDFDIVEKSLKALEIIKDKRVDVGWFIQCYNDYSNDKDRLMMYNQLSIDDSGRDLTQQEYDLLKEVLL